MTAGAAALLPSNVSTLPMIQSARELGCMCVLLAVETYGNWGREAHTFFTRLATRLAICTSLPADLYGRLRLVLTRSIARAIVACKKPALTF